MPDEFSDGPAIVAGEQFSDAADIGAVNTPAPEPARAPGKRRGRPPGSTNSGKPSGASKEKARHSLDLSSITGLFVGLHVIASGMTGVPEVAIDMAEGDAFMKSAQNVMRHYSVESSQKTIDWLAFGGTCCMIYGTRFGAYMLRKRGEAQEARGTGAIVYPTWRGSSGKVQGSQPEQNRPGAMPPKQQQQSQSVPETHFSPEPEFEEQ